jgi:3-methylfumaryl-CoA hydratase
LGVESVDEPTTLHPCIDYFMHESKERADLDPNAPTPAASQAPVHRRETCSEARARQVAAMLDIDPDEIAPGQPLPRGWQFILMGADTRRSALRGDGFPGLGVLMPDLGLPRLLLGGRSVAFHRDIPIGAPVSRTSAVRGVRQKSGAAGAMAVVDIEHALRVDGSTEPAVVETQTYLLLSAQPVAADEAGAADAPPVTADHLATVLPDEILLFQYSALGFNSHRIHLDRDHARRLEGFPDLVVNGGLTTLLLTEFLRRELRVQPKSLVARHVAPLYCNRPVTLAADRNGGAWRLRAFDDRHRLAVDMNVEIQ